MRSMPQSKGRDPEQQGPGGESCSPFGCAGYVRAWLGTSDPIGKSRCKPSESPNGFFTREGIMGPNWRIPPVPPSLHQSYAAGCSSLDNPLSPSGGSSHTPSPGSWLDLHASFCVDSTSNHVSSNPSPNLGGSPTAAPEVCLQEFEDSTMQDHWVGGSCFANAHDAMETTKESSKTETGDRSAEVQGPVASCIKEIWEVQG